MSQSVIGIDRWDCDGCTLTPQMRREILLATTEMYQLWEAHGTSLRWDREVRGLVQTEATPLLTMGDFLNELTGERHYHLRWDFLTYSDELFDWLKAYLFEFWAGTICELDDKPEDEERDPIGVAQCRVYEWLSALRIEDVLEWRLGKLLADSRATDWRSNGF